MKTKLAFHFLLCCQWAPVALSKAYFMGLKEVIANSAVVAIIEGPRSESLGQMGSEGRPKKGLWTYAQKNSFRFVEMFKASDWMTVNQEQDQMLWAEKTFICASDSYALGKYVVFLESAGTNEWSTLKVSEGCLIRS
jgi:hypothetical protein